jgi:hypothetical protein
VRTLWEARDNLTAEEEFAKHIAATKKVVLHRLPRHYLLNYLVADNEGHALGFADIRLSKLDHHPTYAINLRTWETGIRLAMSLCHDVSSAPIIFLIFVRFQNGDKFFRYKEAERAAASVHWFGKTKKGIDQHASEPAVHIPINLFRDL